MVPRRHIPNFTFLDRSERIELEAVVASLLPRLQRLGQVYAFEHGGPYQSLHSCGVDQAHLHLLPLSFDLVDLSSQEEGVSWSEFKPLSWSSEDVEILTEYLWVRSASERGLIGVPSSPQSQWFRKLIARGLNKPDEWDYRKYPALDMINSTSSAFGIVHEHNQRSKE
ncbi:ATP adenylyltransferase [Inquilinus ginsengisoli]|uniref:hypothetical protein n=1 Tax=Inquilinus ginsengisoli TaxID=363840 RepID=UPI003D1E8319